MLETIRTILVDPIANPRAAFNVHLNHNVNRIIVCFGGFQFYDILGAAAPTVNHIRMSTPGLLPFTIPLYMPSSPIDDIYRQPVLKNNELTFDIKESAISTFNLEFDKGEMTNAFLEIVFKFQLV